VKVAAVILTYQQLTNERTDLFDATAESLAAEADRVAVVDNGSIDETPARLKSKWGFPIFINRSNNHNCGRGTNLCARVAMGVEPDICVLSDDDILWRPGWREQLEAWWTAHEDITLTGCHLEPIFPWNQILGKIPGTPPGLSRRSTGAATWSFQPKDYYRIFPIPEQKQGWGDVPACHRLIENECHIAQIDIAEHIGHGRSSWGNVTVDEYGWNVDPVKEFLEDL
jgi:glycosyltransferase involved in cell wall biosynthesis